MVLPRCASYQKVELGSEASHHAPEPPVSFSPVLHRCDMKMNWEGNFEGIGKVTSKVSRPYCFT